MNILEKDLEEIIEKTPVNNLIEKGLNVFGETKRQLRIGSYGIADLVFYIKRYEYREDIHGDFKLTPYLYINICELKKEKAGISAFLQAVRYAKGISHYLMSRGFVNFKLQITLIAPKIDTDSDYIFLTDMIYSNNFCSICSIENYSVKYDFNGVQFKKESGYNLKNVNFK